MALIDVRTGFRLQFFTPRKLIFSSIGSFSVGLLLHRYSVDSMGGCPALPSLFLCVHTVKCVIDYQFLQLSLAQLLDKTQVLLILWGIIIDIVAVPIVVSPRPILNILDHTAHGCQLCLFHSPYHTNLH